MDQQGDNKNPNIGTVLQSVGVWLEDFGKRLDDKISSPEVAEKADEIKKQAADAVNKATDDIMKSAVLIGDAIDSALDSLRKGFESEFCKETENSEPEQEKTCECDWEPCEENAASETSDKSSEED